MELMKHCQATTGRCRTAGPHSRKWRIPDFDRRRWKADERVDFSRMDGGHPARVETALARHLPGPDSIPARLHDAMRYATLGGGKRVRPLLAFAAGELTGAPRNNWTSPPAPSK
jgi:hypothetical protein